MSASARAEVALESTSLPGSQTGVPGPTENVDRIREILFGSQMREYGQRFVQLEEKLIRETGELKAEVRRRLDSLETLMRQEVEALANRLGTERTERTESGDRISREFNEQVRSLERRFNQSEEQVSKDLRELRQVTVERNRSLTEELTEAIANAEKLQNRRLEELRASAVDRFALANFLTELGLRVRGEFHVTGIGDSADAGADG
jgi:uncharacterized protein with von Willebrand factor type A (vWA) domain